MTGAPSTQQTSTSSCNTENPNLLAGSFTADQSASFTYTINVHNAQSQAVTLGSYTLGTQLYSINVEIAGGQNGTFTTVQDPKSETSIPVKTSCGNQFMTVFANPGNYMEDIALGSTTFEDSTRVDVDLQNNGTETTILTSYSVTDSSGNEYTLANWNGPSLAPNSVTTATFSIGFLGEGLSQWLLLRVDSYEAESDHLNDCLLRPQVSQLWSRLTSRLERRLVRSSSGRGPRSRLHNSPDHNPSTP